MSLGNIFCTWIWFLVFFDLGRFFYILRHLSRPLCLSSSEYLQGTENANKFFINSLLNKNWFLEKALFCSSIGLNSKGLGWIKAFEQWNLNKVTRLSKIKKNIYIYFSFLLLIFTFLLSSIMSLSHSFVLFLLRFSLLPSLFASLCFFLLFFLFLSFLSYFSLLVN